MKLKKLLIAVLAAVMVLSLGQSVAFADEAADDTVTVGITTAPVAFDMLLYGAPTQMQLVFEGLFDLNPLTGEIEPWLAESYDWVDDCTLRVKLHDNVYFSNGAKLTAEDVIYSYKRFVDSAGIQSANYNMFDFDKCAAEDELTVLLVTKAPVGSLLMNLSKFTDIVCKDYYENLPDADLWDHTCGTGPYVVDENVSGAYTSFTLRDDYWNQEYMPEVKHFVLQYYSEPSTMLIDFENGAIDMVIGLDESSANRLDNGEYPEATLVKQTTNAVDYLILPEYVEYFQNAKVREAIAHAIDWAAVADNAYGSLGKAATSVLPSNMTNYYKNEGTYEYDPELSRQLLAEAGYPDGFTIDTLAPNLPPAMSMYETIQYYLSEVGITLNYTANEMSAVMPMVAMGQVDFFVLLCNSASSVPDPTAVLEHARADAMLQACKITDPEYNEYYQDFITNTDETARKEDMNWIQDWHKENCWLLPTAESLFAYAYGPKIKNTHITTSMMAELRFTELN